MVTDALAERVLRAGCTNIEFVDPHDAFLLTGAGIKRKRVLDGVIETAFVPASRILPVRDGEAFVLRDRTLPLVRLADLLEIPRPAELPTGMKVVVMEVGEHSLTLHTIPPGLKTFEVESGVRHVTDPVLARANHNGCWDFTDWDKEILARVKVIKL